MTNYLVKFNGEVLGFFRTNKTYYELERIYLAVWDEYGPDFNGVLQAMKDDYGLKLHEFDINELNLD